MLVAEPPYVKRRRRRKGVDYVTAEPLRRWIIEQLRSMGLWDEGRGRVMEHTAEAVDSWGSIARRWGVSSRRLQDVVSGRDGEVPVDLADRVLCGAGEPFMLDVLYGRELDVLWASSAA